MPLDVLSYGLGDSVVEDALFYDRSRPWGRVVEAFDNIRRKKLDEGLQRVSGGSRMDGEAR